MYSVIVVLSILCLFVFVCICCLSELYVLYWFMLDSGICIGLFVTDWSDVSACLFRIGRMYRIDGGFPITDWFGIGSMFLDWFLV